MLTGVDSQYVCRELGPALLLAVGGAGGHSSRFFV